MTAEETAAPAQLASAASRGVGVLRRAARVPPRELATTAWVAALFAAAEISVRCRPIAASTETFGLRLHDPAAPTTGPDATGPDATALPEPTEGRSRQSGPPLEQPIPTERELRGLRAVQRLSPRIYGSERGCLRRSLVMGHVLRRHDPVLRVGVRRTDDGFAAHAWVEVAGEAVEAGVEDYLAFDFGAAEHD